MKLFQVGATATNTWFRLSQLEQSVKSKLKEDSFLLSIPRSTEKLPFQVKENQLNQIISQNVFIIRTWTSVHDSMPSIEKPHLFILSSVSGIILDFQGTNSLIDQIKGLGVVQGTSMAFEHAGLNAISASIQVKDKVILKGEEHDLHIFREWACLCSPIRHNNQIVAYLDLSFDKDEDDFWAKVIMEKVILDIELRFNGHLKRSSLDALKRFNGYGLTKREMEVAIRWLNNKSVLWISNDLGISEGTVRNYTKKIYKKFRVNDKSELMRLIYGY